MSKWWRFNPIFMTISISHKQCNDVNDIFKDNALCLITIICMYVVSRFKAIFLSLTTLLKMELKLSLKTYSINNLRNIYVMAKVYRRIKYTLSPNLEAKVYFCPKLQTWRLMCTLSPNLEAKVNFNFQLRSRLGLGLVRFG